MDKRTLSESEIEDILDFIQPQGGIPFEVAMTIVEINKEKFRKGLRRICIYEHLIPKLKLQLSNSYEQSKIQAGENVGILAAQSFGQFQTQSTLNSFHKAGLSEKTVVSGVSRFSQLLDATRFAKGSTCTIYFKEHTETLPTLKKHIGSSIVGLTLKDLTLSHTFFSTMKPREPWYDVFEKMYDKQIADYQTCISFRIDEKKMYQYQLSLEDIAKKIEETYEDVMCVFSPLHLCVLDVFLSTSSIRIPEKIMSYVTPENTVEVYLEDVAFPNLEKLLICGISGISNIFFSQSASGPWFVETDGSNFSDVLAHPLVDNVQSLTNNIWELYETLGIEAVRQYMIEELTASMTGINVCHSRLLIDKMTYFGTIMSISRYAMRSEGSGPLSKASFEETLDNLLNAAVQGEKESTDGVSAGIICGKLGKFGTGICELRVDVRKLTGMVGNVKEK